MRRIFKLMAYTCLSLCLLFSCMQPAAAAVDAVEKISATKVTSGAVTLKWSEVSDADGYRLYRYSYDNGLWKTVKNTNSLSYTDKTVSAGKRYAYRVRAYSTAKNKKTYGGYSPKVYVNTLPEKVTGISTYDVTSDSVTLKWSKSKGATGYAVYQYDKTQKKYVKKGSTSGNSFTVKGTSQIVDSKFKVRSYARINGKYVYGEYSGVHTNKIALSTVKGVKLSDVTGNSYKISWNAVSCADGYQLQRYNKSDKKWELYKKTTATEIIFSDVSSGIQHDYKVRAYCEKSGKYGYSNYSSAITGTTLPAAPEGLTVTTNKYKGLTLKWKSVKGASGYLVYTYDAANGKWTLLGTTTKNYYYNNNLQQTKNYTYRIRAFVSVNSVNYNGPFCSSVTEFYKVKKQENKYIQQLEKRGIFGYLYDPAEMCFYTSGDPWQRNVGYNEVFDWCAPFTLINFDTERIYFTYKNKDWLVQLWKGQYGLIFYGAEVGVYYKPADREIAHYDSVADDDMLKMSLDFYVRSSITGKWSKKFTRPYGSYWWCTGFLPGNIGGNFDRLRYVLRVTMKDKEMLKAFKTAMNKSGLKCSVDGLDVYINYV